MLKKITSIALMVFCLFTAGVAPQIKKNSVESNQTYVGCWSGGNTPPSVYQFTPTTIKTSVTRKNAFQYKEVFRDEERKIYLLELKQKDRQNYLQKFLAISFVGADSIELKDYETREAFENGTESGKLNVFKEDSCRGFERFFR